MNYNINNSFKLLALNAINVVQSFADLFPTFSNITLPEKPSKSDTVGKNVAAILDF